VFVKRVIGVHGDRLQDLLKQLGIPQRVPIDEPSASPHERYVDPYRDNWPSKKGVSISRRRQMLRTSVTGRRVVIPRGRYFVLGETATFLDSGTGIVEPTDMLGRPLIVLYSQEASKDEAIGKESVSPGLCFV